MDPESGKVADAARPGLRVKAGLEVLKLRSYAKTSGSRSLHVLVPLVHLGPDADEVLAFTESFVGKSRGSVPA